MKFYHLIVLDASGSMDCIRKTALSGCNETIQSIRSLAKNADQEHFLSLIWFNSEDVTHYLYDCCPISSVNDLTLDDYIPNSCTPLYDAVGKSICHLRDQLPKSEKVNVLVTIITDGEENSSELFTAQKIKSLVSELKQSGWTFAFIGANQDEVLEAQKMGINNSMSFEQSEVGTASMFRKACAARARYCAQARTMSDEERDTDFFKDI
ncbi:MAG: VWA domain-containing protein [Paludibacteraceae bacterium]|nr:VWA domain-containing protein [Paludibacteraceae bacterium]